ncbi:hypothetical protein JCM15519_25340 [Fundidesulfovibrio butyratiphilus]
MDIPPLMLAQLPAGCQPNYADQMTVRGRTDLRRFLAGMFSTRPRWMDALFWLRGLLARLFALNHEFAPTKRLDPLDVPMTPGQTLRFFTVVRARENAHWIALAEDRHLAAFLGVLTTPESDGQTRFDVVTVVCYRHWTGPAYFTLVRPFHRLVVTAMARAGAKAGSR